MSCCTGKSGQNHQGKAQLCLKQYDSIHLSCAYTDDDDKPLSLSGISIKSDIRTLANRLLVQLDVAVKDSDKGLFELSTNVQLPVGSYLLDILFSNQLGANIASDTLTININRGVTQL